MASNTLNLPTEETLQSIATSLSAMQGNVSGVKGNEEVTYRTGQVNLTAANVGALPANTTYVSSVNGGSGAVTGIATQQELDEVRGIAEGAGAAMSFANYASLVSDFNNAADDDYKLGQSIYINTLNVPDLWIYEVSSISILYYYTTDEAFTDLLKQQGYVQIGYYKVAALETQKVDLSNYVSLDGAQTITGVKSFTDFSLINDYTNGKTLASYLSDIYTKTESDGKYVDINTNQVVKGTKTFKSIQFVKDTSDPTAGSKLEIQNDNGYNAKIRFNGYGFMFTANSVQPTGTVTLGTASSPWSTVYATSIGNGSTSIGVGNIAHVDNTINVIKVSEMSATNYFTEAQMNILKNGKPTRIEGTIQTYSNILVTIVYEESSQLRCMFSYANNVQCGISYFIVTKSNGYANFRSNKVYFTTNELYLTTDNGGNNTIYINGKRLPNYPSSPASPQVLTYETDNTLSWSNATILYKHKCSFTVGSTSYIVYTYSKSATPATTLFDIPKTFYGSIFIANNGYPLISIKGQQGAGIRFVYDSTSYTATSVSFDVVSFAYSDVSSVVVTDTVTQL